MAKNGTSFRPGPDPRRHTFTKDECSRGGVAGFKALMERRPTALLYLRAKLRKQGKYRPRRAAG